MAKKNKTAYVCTACGAVSPRWMGKCPECQQWDSMAEERQAGKRPITALSGSQVTAKPIRDLVADDVSGAGFKQEMAAGMDDEALNKTLPKFRSDDDIHIVVAGSEAGKFSGAFHGWATGEIGSISVSRKIDEL